ncbi:putative serine/threonine-protein kinase PBL22 isoform X2 [Bidens hawaiensis]|uniref:putative serine/threonine-protein kinase PBL22 isoform X2 n=1 Tax=Bidens hawaiensis TaxID=980011 RepID=UPI00404B7F45
METHISSIPCTKSCRLFSVDEIQSATQNFDDALVVGKGGFGKVYKATITIENTETYIVAIKRLNFDSSQGKKEFLAEIEMLTKLRHCNLVSLIGYCNDNSEMILVYEFMPNGTLDDHLHRKGTNLSWVQRLKISIGAARGLEYLHTGTGTKYGVIHRDVKSTHILLDEDYAAKISDFGLAKFGPTDTSGAFVETRVRGTFGYLDPEYTFTERLTRKSNVFAFGVVLFELLCGRVAVLDNCHDDTHELSLVKWVLESIKKKKVDDIIDLKIKSQISPKCLKEFVQIAYCCLSSESENRPKMVEIVVTLELCLTLQKKFDNPETPAAGILSIGRMIKWPFVSPEVNSAQTKSLEKEHSGVSSAEELQILAHDLKKFSFDDLKEATKNFQHNMTMGQGSYGDVFKGLLDNNTSSISDIDGPLRIVIRRIDYSQIQYNMKKQILGYCLEDEQLFLVYEFMENGPLDYHLCKNNKTPLPMKTRFHIALGVTEAFSFLDRKQIWDYNHTIKLHQILLDKDFNAKVSDSELEKVGKVDSYELKGHPLYLCYLPKASKFLQCLLTFYYYSYF